MELTDIDMGQLVLSQVVHNKHYASKVVPYLEASYFTDKTEAAIAETIINYQSKYSKTPNNQEIVVEMKMRPDVNKMDQNVLHNVLGSNGYQATDQEWLIKNSEKFIRRRRVSNAFAQTYGDFDSGKDIDDIAMVFQEALSFSFDGSIGRSYVRDSDERWGMYTAADARISTMIAMIDRITNGGICKGTLNCFLAGTGVGKSLMMCDMAAKMAKSGLKVLYISNEMAEIKIEERIDANLLDIDVSSLRTIPKDVYEDKMRKVVQEMSMVGGDIITKQYPTSTAHSGHFHTLLVEAKNAGIEFDIVFIDYLNICASKRSNASDSSYTKIKNIAEELRALAIIWDLPIITATQTNRGGQNSTDLDFEDVSESHGLAATLDLFLGLIASEEMQEMGRIMVRQIKNRYGDTNFYKRFPIGVERSKMRIYNVRETEVTDASPTQAATSAPNQKSAIEAAKEKVSTAQTGVLDFSVLGSSKPN